MVYKFLFMSFEKVLASRYDSLHQSYSVTVYITLIISDAKTSRSLDFNSKALGKITLPAFATYCSTRYAMI